MTRLPLPVELTGPRLAARGTILLTNASFQDLTKPKLLVVVSPDPNVETIQCLMATSTTRWFDENPWFQDCVRIPQGRVKAFPKPTVIDCREVVAVPREALAAAQRKGTVKFCGRLPDDLVQELDAVLRGSEHLAPRIKRVVLPAIEAEVARSRGPKTP